MANLFADGFESGTTGAWDSVVDTESDMTVTEGAALHGTYGLNLLIDNTTLMYVIDNTPTTETRYRARFYIDTNGLTMGDEDSFSIFRTKTEAASTDMNTTLNYTIADGYQIQVSHKDDGGSWAYSSAYDITDAPHCIEVDFKISSGADDGFLSLWIDGTLKETIADIDNDSKDVGIAWLGVCYGVGAGTSGTFYLDDFASNNDGSEIGLISDTEDFVYTGVATGGEFTFSGSAATEIGFTCIASGSFAYSGVATTVHSKDYLTVGDGTLSFSGSAVIIIGLAYTGQTGKWPGLGTNMFAPDDAYIDTVLANGFTEVRHLIDYNNQSYVTNSKAAVINWVAKGAKVIWGVTSNTTITAGNWITNVSSTVDSTADTTHFVDDALTEADNYYNGAYFYNITRGLGSRISDFVAETDTITLVTAITGMTAGDSYTIKGLHQSILDAAAWAQDNGVFEFQLGNEEEHEVDGDTMTVAQIIINLKSTATEVQGIFTNGNVSYSFSASHNDEWRAAGRGDVDLMGANFYLGGDEFSDYYLTLIGLCKTAFGIDHFYLTEFSLSWMSLDTYSTDEAVQAARIAQMVTDIKDTGLTRALFFTWKNDAFGIVKANGTYRLLWNSLLNSGGPSFVFSGTATQEHSRYYLTTAEGSLAYSGTATYVLGFTSTGSGSFAFSGEGTCVLGFAYSGSGGLAYSGAADCSYAFGGWFDEGYFGGWFTSGWFLAGNVYVGTGVFTYSGAAAQSYTRDYITAGSGGLTFSGSAEYTIGFAYTASDGLAFSGAGSCVVGFASVGTGTLTYSGTATQIHGYNFNTTASGSFNFSGAGIYSSVENFVYNGTGSLAYSGTATKSYTWNYSCSASGNFNFGGIGTYIVGFSRIGSGTFGFSGAGSYSLGISYTGSGTLTYSGVAVYSYDTEIPAEDFIYTATGKITFSGSATKNYTFNYSYSGSGEFTFSGSAVVQKFNFIFTGSGIFTYSGGADFAYCYSYTKVIKVVSTYTKVNKGASTYTKVDKEISNYNKVNKGC